MFITKATGYQLHILVPHELLVSKAPEAHIAYCHCSELDVRPTAEDISHFSGRTQRDKTEIVLVAACLLASFYDVRRHTSGC